MPLDKALVETYEHRFIEVTEAISKYRNPKFISKVSSVICETLIGEDGVLKNYAPWELLCAKDCFYNMEDYFKDKMYSGRRIVTGSNIKISDIEQMVYDCSNGLRLLQRSQVPVPVKSSYNNGGELEERLTEINEGITRDTNFETIETILSAAYTALSDAMRLELSEIVKAKEQISQLSAYLEEKLVKSFMADPKAKAYQVKFLVKAFDNIVKAADIAT